MNRRALFLLAAAPLLAETTIIDAGSATDSGFTGGTAYSIPAASQPASTTDATMRFGQQFSYLLTVGRNEAQIVTLRFIDPTVSAPGGRVFSVFANNQPMLWNLDLAAEVGMLKPFSRNLLVYPVDGVIKLVFQASTRTAVVSAIEYRPLLDDWWPTLSRAFMARVFKSTPGDVIRIDVGTLSVTGFFTPPGWADLPVWFPIQ